jgi:lipoprotein-anchoring transpeptidase ErfK/SrfK
VSSVELPKRSAVALTGRKTTIGGVTYEEAAGGFWVLSSPLVAAKPEIPSDLAPNEKWIGVDLTRQTLIAFEGKKPVFATLISSGRRNTQDKEKDFPTPTGTFRIGEKHITTTMDGDVASDGPYSIEDVPWVQYFQGSYALHGAFWHDNFGYVRSHGCVNLAPEDARTLFAWTEPKLPDGWHGVFAQPEKGTRVIIHEDDPKKEKKKKAAEAAEKAASAVDGG